MAKKMLKTITHKAVLGLNPTKPKEAHVIYTVYGSVKDIKKGEGPYGPFTKLVGTFEAKKGDEIFSSTMCILPEPMHGLIADAVATSDNGIVDFACNVILAPNDRPGGTGYEFFAEALVEQTENDPLSHLRSQVQAKLEAPKAEDKKAK